MFKENELEFLEEYVVIMKPIAVALDKLQEEENCYYGCFIPTLLVTKEALSIVEPNNLRLRHRTPLCHYWKQFFQGIKLGFRSS